jgi:hypothetical protein
VTDVNVRVVAKYVLRGEGMTWRYDVIDYENSERFDALTFASTVERLESVGVDQSTAYDLIAAAITYQGNYGRFPDTNVRCPDRRKHLIIREYVLCHGHAVDDPYKWIQVGADQDGTPILIEVPFIETIDLA